MGHWNYRLVVTAKDDKGDDWERDLEICEVYYDDAGVPTGYLGRAPGVTQQMEGAVSARDELTSVLSAMGQALDRPLLDVVEGKLVDNGEVL